jgi:hypothetical protein
VIKGEGVYWPLHRNGSSSVVACVFVVARMCLATRRLAMNLIPSQYDEIFGCINVTVLLCTTPDSSLTEEL